MALRAPTPRGLAGLGRLRVNALQRCSTHSGRATGGGAPRFLTMEFEVTTTVEFHITFQCKHGVAVVLKTCYRFRVPGGAWPLASECAAAL